MGKYCLPIYKPRQQIPKQNTDINAMCNSTKTVILQSSSLGGGGGGGSIDNRLLILWYCTLYSSVHGKTS